MPEKSPAHPRMRGAMNLLQRIAEYHDPGSTFDDDGNWDGDERWAFGMESPTAVTRVFANTAGVDAGGTWWFQISTGVGFEVRDIPAAMRWANDRNGESVIGTTYVSIAHHGQFCVLIWEHLIWSGLLAGLGGPAGGVVTDWMARVYREVRTKSEGLRSSAAAGPRRRAVPVGSAGTRLDPRKLPLRGRSGCSDAP
ncbi:hypothetical protein [Actinomycetospora aeridis]|uniref:Polyketide cyclase/dehydrase/lipid transport protein n=1 Tax=Actinomycetospora aeridis TaxID=3129231 RepID=A0ABU8N6I6_9PSEU